MSLITRISSAAAVAALALGAGAASASAGVNPALNHPEYWENELGGTYTCSKAEYADGLKYFELASRRFYVIKAGTVVTTTTGSYSNGSYTSDKDISYIITCVPIRYGS